MCILSIASPTCVVQTQVQMQLRQTSRRGVWFTNTCCGTTCLTARACMSVSVAGSLEVGCPGVWRVGTLCRCDCPCRGATPGVSLEKAKCKLRCEWGLVNLGQSYGPPNIQTLSPSYVKHCDSLHDHVHHKCLLSLCATLCHPQFPIRRSGTIFRGPPNHDPPVSRF